MIILLFKSTHEIKAIVNVKKMVNICLKRQKYGKGKNFVTH